MKIRAVALPLALLAAAGCHGCHEDHPYVPYAIGASSFVRAPGAPSASAALADAGSSTAPPGDPFAGEPALAAPPSATRWSLEGMTLDAPDGQVLVSAVTGDFDGDGAKDAFVIAQAADGTDSGSLLFYRTSPSQGLANGLARGAPNPPPAAIAVTPPATLARDPSCIPVRRLLRVGARSVLVELGARCPHPASAAPSRWVAVVDAGPAMGMNGAGGPSPVAVGAAPRVRLAATLSDPADAPDLSVDAAVADRDGDGRDDLALQISLEGGGAPLEPGPRVSVVLAWLDRPAGLSRDEGATEASFASLASAAMARAARSKEAASVPPYVAQLRALWRAACSDGGSPRVVAVAGTGGITCGAARALEEAGIAEVKAYATLGDPLHAALALDRAERPPASHTSSRQTDAVKWLTALAPAAPARLLRNVAAVPAAPRAREPSWSALAFEASGKLLVRTKAGVVRVDPDLGDEASSGTAEWPAAVTSPDGSLRWIEAYDPCDGTPLRATFELASGNDDKDIVLPVPAPLAGRCAGSRGAPARVVPIAWGPRGLEALVDTVPVLVASDLASASPLASFLDQPAVPGSPRSPNGKAYVLPTRAGFLVLGPPRARILRGSELDGTYDEQRDCVVSDDETHVACVRAGRAWVGTWDAP